MERGGGRQRESERGTQRERSIRTCRSPKRRDLPPFSPLLLSICPSSLSPLIYWEPSCKANILKDEDRAVEGPGDRHGAVSWGGMDREDGSRPLGRDREYQGVWRSLCRQGNVSEFFGPIPPVGLC